MQTNQKRGITSRTHEGAKANHIEPIEELRRSVSACLLWENSFYEDGVDIADRIDNLVAKCDPHAVAGLAVKVRSEGNIRHAPLLMAVSVIDHHRKFPARDMIADVIQRADELPEVLSLYWRKGKRPIAKQLRLGLADAFEKFDEYQFAKWDRKDKAIRIRDVMFLVHPHPANDERAALYNRIANEELKTPDTWEVGLSTGGDKRETFERLLRENRLGYMALLRNLRNMVDAKVDENLVREAIAAGRGADRVLPARYLSAIKHAPSYADALDAALINRVNNLPVLKGTTAILVDVSGSMDCPVSGRSELARWEWAAAIAAIIPAEKQRVWGFATKVKEVPAIRGYGQVSCIDSIRGSIGWGTDIGLAVNTALGAGCDRVIVITDEQSNSTVRALPNGVRGYIINTAAYQNGIGYNGGYVHLSGVSDAVLKWMAEYEEIEQ